MDRALAGHIEVADKRARHGPDKTDALKELSRLYHANGYLADAWQCYRILIALEPKEATWRYRLAMILSGYGYLDEAKTLFESNIKIDPDYIPARIHYGDTLLKLNQLEQSKQSYQAVLEIDRENAYALVGLARVAQSQNDLTRAKEKLEAASKLTSARIGSDLLTNVYEVLGEHSKARSQSHRTIWSSYAGIIDPIMMELMYDRYDAHEVSMTGGKASMASKTQTGIKFLKLAVTLDRFDHMLQGHLASLYLNIGDIDNARKHYQRSLELRTDYPDAWSALIEIEEKSGNQKLADELVNQAIVKCPRSPSINLKKGTQLLRIKQYERSIRYFETAIAVRPNEAIGYTNLARAYFSSNRPEIGIQTMQDALKAEPLNPIALTTMAFHYIITGNAAQAARYIKSYKRLRPVLSYF